MRTEPANEDGSAADGGEIRRALEMATPSPPVEEVDWARLRDRIVSRGEGSLERLRGERSGWWRPAARWTPVGAPFAAAACLLLGFFVWRAEPDARTTFGTVTPAPWIAPGDGTPDPAEGSHEAIVSLLSGEDADELLLEAAFGGEGKE